MIEGQQSRFSKISGVTFLLSACGVGIAVAYNPILGAIAGAILIFVLYGLVFPDLVAWLGLMSLTISLQYVVPLQIGGFQLDSVQKLGVLLTLLPIVLFRGLREKINAPIIAYLIVLFMSFTLSSWHPELEISQAIRAFFGFALGWFVFSLNWKPQLAHIYLLSISLMAIVSVAVGGVLHAVGVYPVYVTEYTGALRLQGASIAPHLAMLAFVGLVSAVFLVARGTNWYLVLAGANFAILVATGTRGALLASLFVLLPYVYHQVPGILRGKAIPLVSLLVFLFGAASALYAYWPDLEARMTTNNPLETGLFNTSGRGLAWHYLLDEAMENPWFGRGLGAGTLAEGKFATEGTINAGFGAPHNEYLRMFVDGGIVGTLLIISAFAVVFYRIYRGIRPQLRPYLLWILCGVAVYSFFDNTLSTPQFYVPFFWCLGVLYTEGTKGDLATAQYGLDKKNVSRAPLEVSSRVVD